VGSTSADVGAGSIGRILQCVSFGVAASRPGEGACMPHSCAVEFPGQDRIGSGICQLAELRGSL
jgi:hypothetical protein